MLTTLRRSRWLGLTLTLVVPGLTPAWLQSAHPCPDMAPWLVEQVSSGHHGHSGHGSSHGGGDRQTPSGQSGHHQGCTCLGSCQVGGGIWSPGESQPNPVAIRLTVDRSTIRTGIDLPLTTPRHTLPLATAPPLG